MSSQNSDPKKSKISEFSDDSLKEIAKEIVVKRTVLLIHFAVYCAVNALLVGINYGVSKFEDGLQDVWAMWAIMGWGIGLMIHCLHYIIFKKGIVNYSSIGATYHIGIYIIVFAFLVFTDYLPDSALSWVWWAVGPWGGAVVLHGLFVFIFLPRKAKKPEKGKVEKKSYIDRKIEAELEKIKKKDGS